MGLGLRKGVRKPGSTSRPGTGLTNAEKWLEGARVRPQRVGVACQAGGLGQGVVKRVFAGQWLRISVG